MNVFTVSVAGSERYDGEAPYTYAVLADDMEAAMSQALAMHVEDFEDDDVIPVYGDHYSFPGLPPADSSYGWIDMTGVRHGVE